MREAIVLYRGEFGQLSIRNVIGDLVTHAHRHLHIILWLEGATGEMMVGDKKVLPGKRIAIGVNSFEPHNHSMAENETGVFLAIYLDPEWLQRHRGLDAAGIAFANPAIPVDVFMHSMVCDLVKGLLEEDGVGHLHPGEILSLIDLVLDTAKAAEGEDCRRCRATSTCDFRIRKAIDVMSTNLTNRLSFDKVARSAGLSRPHFFALFREQMNITPNIFWNMLRMEKALQQLQESDERLTEIAIDLGFSTQGNFSRFFREHIGVPPAVYRSAMRISEAVDT
jgi:AraC-like DNA-binding protein